jgi:RNA polymerase sigma-B factor
VSSATDTGGDREDLTDRNRLVEEHADLAEHFARRYAGRGLARDDLRQMAMLAMVKAADRYDPERGVAFSTFASRTIDGELKRSFRDRSWSVRPPRALQELHLALRKVDEELTHELGRHPRLDELAERLQVGEEDVLEALEAGAAHHADSLDAPVGDSDRTASDRLGTGDVGFGRTEGRMLVEDLLETLPERERMILELRFYENLSQEEIADRIGVSQSYLSRLLRRTLLDLRAQAQGR